MIQFIEGYEHTNIIGVEINGTVSSDDIVILEDAIETKLDVFPKIRMITHMVDHKGWTFTGLIKDFFNKFKHAKDIERSAVIANDSWDDSLQLADQLTSGEMKRFSPRHEKKADEWIRFGALINNSRDEA